ncbi:MAG TPA: hypothetical protein VNN08_13815, partial [Thermoanaerobaculia bacterium]|nr:hypothetical protein [Thermoanaerobaculia bacterium]
MSRILLAASLLIALAGAAVSAEVRLGPETPVTPLGILGPAVGTQDEPAVASNGNDFLAIWRDQRRGNPWGSPDIYATRIGRDGQPVDRGGRRIAENVFNAPVIASNGGDYLACYQTGGHLVTQRLDENGAPAAPPTDLRTNLQPLSLTPNGSGYLLAATKDQTETSLMLLDGAGISRGTVLTLPSKPKVLGVRNGSYAIIEGIGVDTPSVLYVHNVLHMITPAGDVTDQQLPTITFTDSVFLTAAMSPDAILIGWDLYGSGEGGYMLAGYDGRTIQARTPIFNSRLGSPSAAAALWDGNEFLMAFNSDYLATGFRISSAGSLLDSKPIAHPYEGGAFAFAKADSLQVAVWSDTRFGDIDIVARTFTSFEGLVTSTDQASLISWSGSAQTEMQAARSGDHQLAVWCDRFGRILGYAGDVPIEIGPTSGGGVAAPAVAAAKSEFLIAWYQFDASGLSVLATRVSLDGRVLDSSPIVLWTGTSSWLSVRPAVASDGSSFFVSWTTDEVFMSRIAENGTVLSLSAISIGPGTLGNFYRADGPQAAWTGTGFFLGYALVRSSWCDAKCHLPAGIGGLSAEKLIPSVLFDSVDSDALGDVSLAMAFDGKRVTFVWSPSGYGLGVAQTTPDGKPLTGPRNEFLFSRQWCVQNPVIAWNGTELVAAWIDQCDSTVRAVRLNQFGDAIETPFDVAANVLAH